MNNKIYKLAFTLAITLGSTTILAESKGDDEGNLPKDWYTTPEENFKTEKSLNTEKFEETKKDTEGKIFGAGKRIDNIFKSTHNALNKFDEQVLAEKESRDSKWRLTDLILRLVIGAKGPIGLLVGSGRASAKVYWHKVSNDLSKGADSGEVLENAKEFEITDNMSREEINSLINDIVDATVATGKIEDEQLLKRGLNEKISEFHSLVTGISPQDGNKWKVSRYMLGLSVSASGMVTAGVAVGGDIRLRFTFKNTGSNRINLNFTEEQQKRRSELTSLLSTLANDFSQTDDVEIAQQNFYLKTFRVSIGMSVSGSIGVVKAGGNITGHVYFERVKENPLNKSTTKGHNTVKLLDEIPMIDSSDNLNTLEFAKANSISFVDSPSSRSRLFRVNRNAFRKGIKKSYKISSFLAKAGNKFLNEKWNLNRIKPQFQFSIAGPISLIKLSGIVGLELDLRRK
ncbi:MAG: hypothetical protein R3B45_11210 [Bdellovibrionota bacterium]